MSDVKEKLDILEFQIATLVDRIWMVIAIMVLYGYEGKLFVLGLILFAGWVVNILLRWLVLRQYGGS
jgi:hypothetical protein